MGELNTDDYDVDTGELWYSAYREWNTTQRSAPDPLPEWRDLPDDTKRAWLLQSVGVWRQDPGESRCRLSSLTRIDLDRPVSQQLAARSSALAMTSKQRPHQKKRNPERVYFIRAENGPIKIGISGIPAARLQSLQTASPVALALMASYASDNARAVEQMLHRRFAHLRLHGEWFAAGEDLLQFVASIDAASL